MPDLRSIEGWSGPARQSRRLAEAGAWPAGNEAADGEAAAAQEEHILQESAREAPHATAKTASRARLDLGARRRGGSGEAPWPAEAGRTHSRP